MLFPNPEIAKRVMEERVRDSLRKAERRRLLYEAGIDQRRWLSRRACWLLAGLGHLLVVLGQRLERFESRPGTVSVEFRRALNGRYEVTR